MEKSIALPRGTSDILPTEVPAWQQIETSARNLLKAYNYQEIRTPAFEEIELFARSMGQTSDVVQKQMLTLASQKVAEETTSSLALRPEATASVVRSYISNRFDKKESLSKLYYIGPMFRGERPQKGRLRQFHQIGVEAIGPQTASAYLDAEIISLSVRLLEVFGLKEFKLKINTLGSAQDKENFSKILRQKLKPFLPQLSQESQARFERNVFRVLDSKNKQDKEIVAKLNIDLSYLSKESQEYYTNVKKALDELGVRYEESLDLVRGLDYYTHTVFEISGASLGSQDALGAGGRYNDLVAQLGGPNVDAMGFALGIERILLALGEKEQAVSPLDVYCVAVDAQSLKKIFQLLNVFRAPDIGLSCDAAYKLSSVKSQMRQANKLNAKAVVIIGEEELKQESVVVKDMKTGEETKISIKDNQFKGLVAHLVERFK